MIYDKNVLKNKRVFISCAACLTVFTETLKWANDKDLKKFNIKITYFPEDADVIIVLGCQVTDLAILNDFHILDNYMKKYPNKEYYIGGCVAQRPDIDSINNSVNRIGHLISLRSTSFNKNLVFWEKPFWIKDYNITNTKGNLFRYDNHIQVGRGCHGKCKFCSIKTTRGKAAQVPFDIIKFEMKYYADKNKPITFVADTISYNQIKETANIAIENNQIVSYRNIEPQVLVKSFDILYNLAIRGFLHTIHSPIQSLNSDILTDMNRDVDASLESLKLMNKFNEIGVYTATNIIINYKDFKENSTYSDLVLNKNNIYNHVAINPYWDGIWDYNKALQRYKRYILCNNYEK